MHDAVLIDTVFEFPEEPDWRPLTAVARLSRSTDALPSLDEDMYMAAVVSRRDALRIHLYKHWETRRYLNLDDGGHAYQYCGLLDVDEADGSGGTYRLQRSLGSALVWALS